MLAEQAWQHSFWSARDRQEAGITALIELARRTGSAAGRARVCVLIPTRNEAANVGPLLARLGPVLAALGGEVLLVDDSDDQTPAVARAAARRALVPVRVLHRAPGDRAGGLGGAVQAGMAAVTAPWTVVMDGDLQHPPERVPDLLAAADHGADIVVATRRDDLAVGFSSKLRGVGSRVATRLARLVFLDALAQVSDPMSGFFAIRTAAVRPAELRPRGFKILLELLVRCPSLRVAEVPFMFAGRHRGRSKASSREACRYLRQLAVLRMAPAWRTGRLLRFALAGASGVAFGLALAALLLWLDVGASWAGGQILAVIASTQLAIGWQFALTERWVFPRRAGRWTARLFPFWILNCGALLAQLPLAARLQSALGGSYLLAIASALALLVLARFELCERWLYRPAGRRRGVR